jgi:hypothetical protein
MGKVKVAPKSRLTRFQSFVVEEVGREVLQGAPYNPRRITDDARARLKAKIEKVGLVTPLVWNRRTGNLVGGHQRLGILDELEGRQDYRLRVSVVDVDEREERALNVFLNNQASQGDWDVKALAEIAKEFPDDALADLGFVAGEIDFLPGASGAGGEGGEEEESGGEGGDTVPRETQDGTQVVVVFRDAAETDAFMRFIGASLDSCFVDAAKHFKRRGFEEAKP